MLLPVLRCDRRMDSWGYSHFKSKTNKPTKQHTVQHSKHPPFLQWKYLSMQPPLLYITQETLSSLDKGLVYHCHSPKQQFQRKWEEFHIKANISVSTSQGVQSLLTFICFGPQHLKSLKDTDEMEGAIGFFPTILEERKEAEQASSSIGAHYQRVELHT